MSANILLGGSTRRSFGIDALKVVFLILSVTVFISDVTAFFSWSQRRGVFDDLCYLRQAHLFQRFGLAGIDTDSARDDDGFFRDAQKAIGLNPDRLVCHREVPTGKHVMLPPPGTGLLLSLFSEQHQVAWLYTSCALVLLGGVFFLIGLANSLISITAAGLFGLCALYFMVNPIKASYSMAPTTAVLLLTGALTPYIFMAQRWSVRLLAAASVGILLGLSVSFRTANLFLLAGYVVVLGWSFIQRKDWSSFKTGAAFSIAYLVGLLPSLIANYVNAGSPIATTYGPNDTIPADFSFSILKEYAVDMQLYLALVLAAGTIWLWRESGFRSLVAIAGINLVVNLGYFFSHPIFTQYYIMPILILCGWALLVQWLLERVQMPKV